MINKNILDTIKQTKLFSLFSEEELNELFNLNTFIIREYSKDEIVFFEGDTCNHLSIVIFGYVEIQQNNSLGNSITIARLNPKNMFGENLIFSEKSIYPMDIISKRDSLVVHIKKEKITKLLMTKEIFLLEFLKLLSNKAIHLSSKIRQLNMKSLRERITTFLIHESKIQKSNVIKLNVTKEALASEFGVQRPSLSRELIKMKSEGLIDYNRKSITILQFDKLSLI